jgi:hypothetical protein
MKKTLLLSLALIYRISDTTYKCFFPVLNPIIYESNISKLVPGQVENLMRLSIKALRGNLTYFLDKKFRESLIQILTDWSKENIDFVHAKKQITYAIEQRPKWLRFILPSHCFSQILGAFGFFTFMDPNFQTPFGWRRIPIRGKITLISTALRISLWDKKKIWKDFIITFNSSENPFDSKTVQFFRNLEINKDYFNVTTPVGRSLIIGPSEVKNLPSPNEFDFRLLLVTASSNIDTLKQRTSLLGAGWIINSEFAKLLCDPLSNPKLKVAAQKAQVIYCNHNWTNQVQSIVEVPVITYNSNFMDLWLAGSPNLLHRALGITMNKGHSATIVGANLYIADNIYQQTISQQGQSIVQPKRNLHEFFTCSSYSDHSPPINFIAAKRLKLSGWIMGDEKTNEVLSWSLHKYLLALEKSIGERRL